MRHNLSDINDLIRDRRTIYPEQYSTRVVHKEIIENLLNNAIWAPTHGMTQPWRFKVYRGEARVKLSEFLSETYKSFAGEKNFDQAKYQKLKNRPLLASAVIAICMQRDKDEKIPEIEEVEAIACAVQNMHLTATGYGLGAFWSTPKFIYTSHANAFLGLGEKDKCLGFFYLGYPEISWPKGQRRPIEYLTEWHE